MIGDYMADNKNHYLARQIQLATFVLAGILTEQQVAQLVERDEPIPETWQEIVEYIRNIQDD